MTKARTNADNVSGDIAGITAGTGLTGGGTGGTVTLDLTTPVASTNGGTGLSSFTTGDIIYSSSGNTLAKLGIGTTSQVLTVAGGVPSWATPSSGGMTLINTGGTTLSGTTTTISSIPGTYKHLFGVIEGAYGAAQDNNVGLRLNGDTGNNYFVTEIYRGGSSTTSADYDNNSRLFRFTSVSQYTSWNEKGYGTFSIYNYASSTYHHVEMQGRGKATSSSWYSIFSQGTWNSATAITSISVVSDTSLSGGTIYLYGVN